MKGGKILALDVFLAARSETVLGFWVFFAEGSDRQGFYLPVEPNEGPHSGFEVIQDDEN